MTSRARNVIVGLGVLAALGSGASAAGAEVSRNIILDSAEECREYCGSRTPHWNSSAGHCRCW